MSNPTRYTDPDGEFAITTLLASTAGRFALSVAVDGLATGLAYRVNGKSFFDGLKSGVASSLFTGGGEKLLARTFLGGVAGSIISSTVASMVVTLWENKGSIDNMNLLGILMDGILSGSSSFFLGEMHEFALEDDLLLKLAPELTENTV